MIRCDDIDYTVRCMSVWDAEKALKRKIAEHAEIIERERKVNNFKQIAVGTVRFLVWIALGFLAIAGFVGACLPWMLCF